MPEYSIIGKSVPRVDAKVKATGQAKYTADLELSDTLWGKLLRSPHPHARILSIDTSRAERLPGVKAVITGKDFEGFQLGIGKIRDMPPLAIDRVRYIGEAVAAVAAIHEDIAEEAAELINVDYEELPGVFDPEEAMREGVPQLHDYAKNNIGVAYHWNFGDVEEAFSKSYLVREDRFRTGKVIQGYLEPSAVLAYYDPANYITVWATKQTPRRLYASVAECFRLPLSKVRVIQPFIGGGFGGTKNYVISVDLCAVLLSKKTGKPVKIVNSQEEEFATGHRRYPVIIDIKTGVKRDGTLLGICLNVIIDAGAYIWRTPLITYLTGGLMTLPYKLPNFKYDGYSVLTNHPVSGAMRGFGVIHTRFAAEVQMNMIAEELGIDPVEIRLRNAIKAPYETVNKLRVKSCGLTEAIEKVAENPVWRERSLGRREGNISRGTGLSSAAMVSGTKTGGYQVCAAIIAVCEDGSVNLLTGATDCGQGSDTVLCQIAAEELGIAMDDVEIKRVDSAYTPVDPGSFGGRVTQLAGNATKIAAADAKRQLLEFAAKLLGVNAAELDIRDRKIFVKSAPEKSMSFSHLAKTACCAISGEVIIGRGYSKYSDVDPVDFTTGVGNSGSAYSFTAQSARVKVDMETGQTRCTDTIIAHDSGRPLNPMSLEGQNEGCAVQGLGHVLYESFVMDKGRTLNPTLLDYKMPRSTDVPNIESIHIITDEPDGPFGAKEVGEGPIVSTLPALVSAIHDATGVWFKELPITPEKIVKALKEKKK